jgi:hypothetical protein
VVKHLASLALVLVTVGLVYSRVTQAYFCGFDDFIESHRAAFEDAKDRKVIWTTVHRGTFKYRPVNRELTYLSYWWGLGSPEPFRLRNLGFHWLGIAGVYWLGWLLFRARAVAVGAALLFGLCPLANQTVVAAIFTNSGANALTVVGLAFFVHALHARAVWLWLAPAFLCAGISLLTYEATIVGLGFMYGYLALVFLWQRELVRPGIVIGLAVGTAVVIGVFWGLRFFLASGIVRHDVQVVPLRAMFKSAAMYGGALVMPLDPVFANEILGTPLPPDIPSEAVVPVGLAALGALAIAAWSVRRSLMRQLAKLSQPQTVFLAGAIGLSLLPFLVGTDHASETYLNLAAAFYALLIASVIRSLSWSPRMYVVLIAMVAFLFGAATWIRNEQVVSCGRTARHILDQLPLERLSRFNGLLVFASAPDEPTRTRYGMYGLDGLNTIAIEDQGINCAVQLLAQNEALQARIVPPLLLESSCPSHAGCYRVHADGRVDEIQGPGSAR